MLVLFIAGSKTVQTTTTNLIATMAHEPEAFSRLRAEIDSFMGRVKDDIMTKMNLEEVEELEFVKMCYQESLRRDPPLAVPQWGSMTKSVNIDGVLLNPGDPFVIGIYFC